VYKNIIYIYIPIFDNNYTLHATSVLNYQIHQLLSHLGNGTDFISDDIVATFNPGETTATVVVPVVADDLNNEGTEFFALGLRLPNVSFNSELTVNLGSNHIATASILDVGKRYYSCNPVYSTISIFLTHP